MQNDLYLASRKIMNNWEFASLRFVVDQEFALAEVTSMFAISSSSPVWRFLCNHCS